MDQRKGAPEDLIPVSPEEEEVWTVAELADAYLQAAVFWINLPLTFSILATRPYAGPPSRWPFRGPMFDPV